MEKLQLINLFEDVLNGDDFQNLCFSDDEIEEYKDFVKGQGTRDPYIVFEGDPDYMITPEGDPIYFIRIKDKIYYINSSYYDYMDQLLEFCKGQNPKVSIGGYNTRSETKNRKYLENNNREGFDLCDNLKIAYRGGCGYCYTLFEYIK